VRGTDEALGIWVENRQEGEREVAEAGTQELGQEDGDRSPPLLRPPMHGHSPHANTRRTKHRARRNRGPMVLAPGTQGM
jgi:hypothetical protein